MATAAERVRSRPSFEVLVVTPEGISRADLDRTIREGARVLGSKLAVQARAKSSRDELVRVATSVAELASSLGLAWFVNGDPALALELGAHLHVPAALPREGLREQVHDAWISGAAHRDEDVAAAVVAGFDAVLVSPIFDVPGKGAPRGVAAVTRAARAFPALHVVALGGIGPAEARACFDAGADAVAVMRAPFADPSFFERLVASRG